MSIVKQAQQIKLAVQDCDGLQCTRQGATRVLLQGINRLPVDQVDLACCTLGTVDLACKMRDIKWSDYTSGQQNEISAAVGDLLTSL